MSNIVDRFFSRKDQRSAKTAMERLRFVLVTDRSQLSPEKLREMQAEIIEVIKKYCRIDESAVEMKLELRERENYLVADIPLAKSVEQPHEEPGRIAFSLQTSNSSSKSEEEEEDSE